MIAPLPDVRESDDAGRYYCAHSLYLAHELAREAEAPLVHDERGRPFAGFLHVPADPQATGAPAVPDEERHERTRAVVGAALAGWLPALAARTDDDELRVLVTGFGAFREVTDNPTGAFVRARANGAAALRLGLGEALVELDEEEGGLRARVAVGEQLRTVALHLVPLPVDDRCLAPDGEGSLRAALLHTRAHAWLGLGACRSSCYRVEVAPSDVGLVRVQGRWRHDGEAPARTTLPRNRSLLEAMYASGAPL